MAKDDAKPTGDAQKAKGGAGDGTDMDRRVRTERRAGERRKTAKPVDVDRRKGTERRKAVRRKRNINQYDLEAETLEFIRAINRFKERSGRAFPTWSEVLQILRDLGYEKHA